MQQRDGPGESGQVTQTAAAKKLGGAEHRDRDRSIFRGRVAEQGTPVVLLKCVENGQHRAQDTSCERHDP
jgi:hypothetical protein